MPHLESDNFTWFFVGVFLEKLIRDEGRLRV